MKVRKSIPAAPKLEALDALAINALEDEQEFERFEVAGQDLSSQDARHVSLQTGKLSKVMLVGSVLEKFRLMDVVLDGCDASAGEWAKARLTRVALKDCKLSALKFAEAQLDEVLFEDCIMDGVQMLAGQLENVKFKNCRLRGADFRDCKLQHVEFRNCDLSNAMLFNAKCKDVNLGGSNLAGIECGAGDMKGWKIDQNQLIEFAPHLAFLLGIEVHKDSD